MCSENERPDRLIRMLYDIADDAEAPANSRLSAIKEILDRTVGKGVMLGGEQTEVQPVEIVFLFWSLAVGIVIGAGMIPLAVIGSAIIGVILLLFANRKIHNNPYILVMNCADEKTEKAALDILGKDTEHYIVKSKTITTAGIELTAELRTKEASTGFVNLISRLPGVENATLVSYNGEYLS